jgi:predicted ATP-grasp superfamily ATP-dependent carboligase
MSEPKRGLPPVLLLGGLENALAVVRSLGKKKIPVIVSAKERCPALLSRFCKHRLIIPADQKAETFWENLLLRRNRDLREAVLFPCNDEAVAFLATHREELEQAYILDDFSPAIHQAMLDKQKTLELARSVGCPIPRFWKVEAAEDVELVRKDVLFPVLVKPIHSHQFQQVLGKKFFVVNSERELKERTSLALQHNLRIMVCELIPGLDSVVQSSYYTYIDREGKALFRFTKRVIRRYPLFGGPASSHLTQWLPETAEMGERFFRGIGFRGLGNVEFKRDPRDGLLKIIECNPRFTAAHELLVRCGMDSAYIIYCKLTNHPLPPVDSYQEDIGLWYLLRDLKALRQLGRQGDLSIGDWLRSVARRQAFPYFRLGDPYPFLGVALA